MTKWLAIGVVIVILLVGGYFLFGNNSQAPSLTNTQTPAQDQVSPTETGQPSVSGTQAPSGAMKAEENTVTLSAEGFSPATLTVSAGTKVTWKNTSGAAATVNSDPHPVHTDYPPLNLGKFGEGESLSLTFDKPGTYGYHNHFDPSQKGTIIVK